MLILLGALSVARAEAATTTGTVIDVRGQTVFIELNAGPPPRVGDLAELSVDVGGDQVVIGTWRITKLSGPVVEAQALNAQLPPQKGMQARIGGIAPPAPVTPPAQAKPATPPPPVAPPVQARPATQPAPVTPPGQAQARPPSPPPSAAPPPAAKSPPPAAPAASVQPAAPVAAAAAPAAAADAVQFIKTARYDRIWRDKRSGAAKDFAVWRPAAQNDFLPLGDVAVAGRGDDGDRYPPPTEETYLARNGKPPMSYRKVWSSEGTGSKKPFSSWMPVPPDGYKCVGDVGSESLTEPPSLDAVRCVPASCVIETELGEEIWEDRGSGAVENFSAWRVPKVNTYVGNASHKRPRGIFYTLSDACL